MRTLLGILVVFLLLLGCGALTFGVLVLMGAENVIQEGLAVELVSSAFLALLGAAVAGSGLGVMGVVKAAQPPPPPPIR